MTCPSCGGQLIPTGGKGAICVGDCGAVTRLPIELMQARTAMLTAIEAIDQLLNQPEGPR